MPSDPNANPTVDAPVAPTIEERILATLRVILHGRLEEVHTDCYPNEIATIADELVAAELARTQPAPEAVSFDPPKPRRSRGFASPVGLDQL